MAGFPARETYVARGFSVTKATARVSFHNKTGSCSAEEQLFICSHIWRRLLSVHAYAAQKEVSGGRKGVSVLVVCVCESHVDICASSPPSRLT